MCCAAARPSPLDLACCGVPERTVSGRGAAGDLTAFATLPSSAAWRGSGMTNISTWVRISGPGAGRKSGDIVPSGRGGRRRWQGERAFYRHFIDIQPKHEMTLMGDIRKSGPYRWHRCCRAIGRRRDNGVIGQCGARRRAGVSAATVCAAKSWRLRAARPLTGGMLRTAIYLMLSAAGTFPLSLDTAYLLHGADGDMVVAPSGARRQGYLSSSSACGGWRQGHGVASSGGACGDKHGDGA